MRLRAVLAPEPPRLSQLSYQIFSVVLNASVSLKPFLKYLHVQCLSTSKAVLIFLLAGITLHACCWRSNSELVHFLEQDDEDEDDNSELDASAGRFVRYQFTPAFLRLRTVGAT